MTAATRSEQSRRDLTKSSPMGYAVAQLAKAASLIFAVSVITFFLAKVSGFNPVAGQRREKRRPTTVGIKLLCRPE